MSEIGTTATNASPGITPASLTDDDCKLLTATAWHFATIVGNGRPIFKVEPAQPMWPAFLAALPDELRQIYTCNTCRHFVERFGDLVVIQDDGTKLSAVWDASAVPLVFAPAIAALQNIGMASRVSEVFLSSEKVWGVPATGLWSHFAVTPPINMIHRDRTATPQQKMAERSEDFAMLRRSLNEYPITNARQALLLLTNGQLFRSEKCIGVAQWFFDLHTRLQGMKNGRLSEQVTWLAVATAPPGFCHIKAGMIGTLLEDLAAGMDYDDIKRRFNAKMAPDIYRRPTAPPTEGNIQQAEKAVEALGIAPSLRRRFARLEEVDSIWRPAVDAPPADAAGGGVFEHLRPKTKQVRDIDTPPVVMTWAKFSTDVLPTASKIDLDVPGTMRSYVGLVTAVDPAAPPILQWDTEERRNPVSFYVYMRGSFASGWNLRQDTYAKVTAITRLPHMWYGRTDAHHGDGVFLLLEGARDLNYKGAGAGFFPEQLRSELHAVRAVFEAYALNAKIEGAEEASACGLDLRKGGMWDVTVRVTTPLGRASYRLDRWD